MKKKVNGKTVEVGNIEVFEKAAEGMALNRSVNSQITDTLGIDLNIIDDYISLYSSFYKSLPFPLYAIDTDLKYTTIGCFIKKSRANEPKMWVNNGLYICIDEDKKVALNFINNTWGLVRVESIKEDNLDLEAYKDECGFNDLIWALAKVLSRKSTSTYYTEFMGDFIKACNNQPMVLKWELSNILDFGRIPSKYNLPTNKILNLDTLDEYILDIYVSGVRESKEKKQVWSLFGDEMSEAVKSKVVKQYGFDVYIKSFNDKGDNVKPNGDRLRKCELHGALSVFNTLYSIKNVSDSSSFDDFVAFIAGETLVYCVNNRMFVAKANKYVEPKEVARGVELYAYDRGMIYFTKSKQIGKGIKKETIYSYSLKDGNLRLCKIQFVNN